MKHSYSLKIFLHKFILIESIPKPVNKGKLNHVVILFFFLIFFFKLTKHKQQNKHRTDTEKLAWMGVYY